MFMVVFRVHQVGMTVSLTDDVWRAVQPLMTKTADFLKVDLAKLVLQFDGHSIQTDSSPQAAGVDDEDQMDIHVRA